MRRARFSILPHQRHPLPAVAALALLLAPLVAALDHPVHESAETSPIHTEAAHPDAAPHFEPEEHLHLQECLVCVHGARLFADTLGTAWQPAVLRGLEGRTASTGVASISPAPRRSRGPPA